MSPAHTHPVADASVRLATANDAEAIGTVHASVFRAAYAALLSSAVVDAAQPEAFAAAWRASLENPPSAAYRLLVASAGERVVGFVALGPNQDPDADDVDAELLVGGIDPAARREGHGSRLLNAAADTATQSGFVRMRAWLLEADAVTRAFLEGAGFVADGARRERLVGPDDGDVAVEVRVTADIPE